MTQEERARLATFEQNATAPKRVQTDSGSVEQHSLNDQIKALEYLKKKDAEEKGRSALSRMGFYKRVPLD